MPDTTEHVTNVVVGSGFGGSVSAYRLAEAGQQVVVLERGKAYAPGDFPRSPAGIARNLWDPSAGLHGLFNLWVFKGIDAVVSSGLGGGSLIYANVLLRKDEKWFVKESPLPGGGYETWPVMRADLDQHYDRVEQMIQPQIYPADLPPYNRTAKTQALRDAAEKGGLEWQPLPLAVSFAPQPGQAPVVGAAIPEPSYGNWHGLPRRTCRLCGECDLGCNEGSKNTLDHTYLSAAKHHGADIRIRHEVRSIEPRREGGYEVGYVVHRPEAEGTPTKTERLPVQRITCDRLFLAAGSLGTTYLLLSNRKAFDGISDALGSRFSGNGDLLTVMMGAKGLDGAHRSLQGSYGPVITSAVRVPDESDGGAPGSRGHYIQDAGYPVFADWLVEATQLPGAFRRALAFAWHRLRAMVARSPRTQVSAEIAALLGRSELSDGSLPLLGMGRDVADGVMDLDDGYLRLDWSTKTSRTYFDGVHSTMTTLADSINARLVDLPLWWFRKVITVHPLGGAPMGRNAIEGVTDEYGEVHGFPGMYVVDGAVMPGPVGPNPSLTIAALADRTCDHVLDGSRVA
jgi:cholesterol oxidase